MLALLFESLIRLLWSYSPLPYPSNSVSFFPSRLMCATQMFSDVWSTTGVWLTYQRLHSWENALSPCERLTIANSSMARVGLGARLPTPRWDLFYIGLHRLMCAVPTTVNLCVQLPRCVQKTMLSYSHLESQDLNTLSTSSSTARALSRREHAFDFSDVKVNHELGRMSRL